MAATNIARWDGTNWFAMGTGFEGPVYSLAAHEGVIYAGGAIFSSGGGPGTNIARWNGADWSPLGSLPNTVLAIAVSTNGSEVYAGHALLVHGNDLYLGGQFWNVGGVDATNLARWDGTNWWPVGGGVEFVLPGGGTTLKVAALGMADGKLYVGGNFTHTGDSAEANASNIARWDGTNWFTFNGGVPFIVRALVVDKNDLYVAGGSWWGEPGIAKWDGTNLGSTRQGTGSIGVLGGSFSGSQRR